MTTLETPQFSNSCGKIFADKIVLATAHKESEVALSDITKINFIVRPQPKSLFFAALPAMLIALPYMTNEKDGLIIGFFIAVSLILTGVALYNLNKKYTLSVKLATGNSMSINVWQGNQKEAQKFVAIVKSKISKIK
jgi:hypothetical protein